MPAEDNQLHRSTAGVVRGAGTRATNTDVRVRRVLDALLLVEQVAVALYYIGLTTPAVVGHPYLAGNSADPNAVASNGSPVNVANAQAALDQEAKHAAALVGEGAHSAVNHVFFPAATFSNLGYTRQVGSFLWVLDHVETQCIGAYLVAVGELADLGRTDLAQFAARVLSIEAQHRVLGRILSGDNPANNVGLEFSSFTKSSQIAGAMRPYLSGKGLTGGATPPLALPRPAQIAHVIGQHVSR